MRARPILLSKTCPYCGARSVAEAKLPAPTSIPGTVEYNLDNLGALVESLGLNTLLALVELLPYKTFACRKCQGEFRLESKSTKELVRAMLSSLQPVVSPLERTRPAAKRRRPEPLPAPEPTPMEPAKPNKPAGDGWDEPESLDRLFDYSVDTGTDGTPAKS